MCRLTNLAVLVLYLTTLVSNQLNARDDGRFANSPLKPWFDRLASGKGLCCSFADGFSVQDVDWDSGFRIIAGSPRGFTKQADSGNPLTRYFCPECGSPLYTVPVHPEVLYVKAGTLDDPRLVQPRRQNWMRSRVSWTTIDPELPGSPRNPEGRT
jgi:hypothetical protein